MKCFKLSIALSAVLLLLTACSGIGVFGGTKNPQTIGETHQGTQGIAFDFVTNYPPSIIYLSGGDTGTNILLDVRNLGSFDTTPQFYFSGFDTKILPNMPSGVVYSQMLKGRSPTNPDGGYFQLQVPTYSTLNVNMPKDSDIFTFNLQATACFDYETQASLAVCVDPNPYGAVTQKACIPHGAASTGGQGAPIAITSAEQESLKNKVIFKITVTNSGGGQVYEKGKTTMCTRLAHSDLNKITYSPFTLGGQAGTCTPASPVSLRTGQSATITCVFSVTGDLAYTTTLNADLMYGYMLSKQRSVQIKKIS